MHDIEPYYNWRYLYTAETDERSPFYGREYSEFEFSKTYITIISTHSGMISDPAPFT
jgi:hypothetical protein